MKQIFEWHVALSIEIEPADEVATLLRVLDLVPVGVLAVPKKFPSVRP